MRTLVVLCALTLTVSLPARAGDLAPEEPVRVQRGVAYVEGGAGALQSLDVYAPSEAPARARPVIVFVHGGGWRLGDKRSAVRAGEYFAGQGFVFLSVNYRLSPAVTHPAHVGDVVAALAWARANGAGLGGDPERLVVMGHSAGAHLAALAALDAQRLKAVGLTPAAVAGVVLLDGAGYDIPRQIDELGSGFDRRLYEAAFGEDRETWRDASPLTHVRPEAASAAYLILHVGRRAARIQAEAFGAALVAAGGRAEVVEAAGKTHRTINRELGQADDEVTARVLAFLKALDPTASVPRGR